jgi:hypothetical protein
VHHRNRILKEKERDYSSVRSFDDYTELTKHQIAGFVIESNVIPPGSYDDPPVSGAREIYTPSPGQINNISRAARRFMQNHKCSYKDFINACFGQHWGYDMKESLKKDAIFVISSRD